MKFSVDSLQRLAIPKRFAGQYWALTLLILCGIAGCTTANNFYAASELPSSLVAPMISNAQTITLTKFAMPAATSSRIEAGDVIEVTIAAGLSKENTSTLPVRIPDDGTASLPLVGRVPLAGLELMEAEQAIASACIQRGLYRAPHITVIMKQQRMNRITVVGAVNEPGVYELPRGGSDLLSALVAAGSLDENAGTMVEIRQPNGGPAGQNRTPPAIAGPDGDPNLSPVGYESGTQAQNAVGGPSLMKIDLASVAKRGNQGLLLSDGAVINVEKRDPKPIHVLGLVNKPGKYDMPVGKKQKVLDAVAVAGGMSNPLADKIFIIRQLENQPAPAVITVSVRKAKRDGKINIDLAPGDVVTVERTPMTVLLDAFQVINFGASARIF